MRIINSALLDKGDPEFEVAAGSGAHFERPLHICNSVSSWVVRLERNTPSGIAPNEKAPDDPGP
jgi:hypothetical protein